MAGGGLKVLFSSGDLHAWMTAQMDPLIEGAPLHYELTIDISIGVSYRLNLVFVSLTINIELDADLTIWGPPTGGTVHVNWYVISLQGGFRPRRGGRPPTARLGQRRRHRLRADAAAARDAAAEPGAAARRDGA